MGIFQFNSRIITPNQYPFGYEKGKQPFSPADIPTAIWLDAAATDTITLDGSNNVSQWNDKSGNLHHAIQSTSYKRPSVNISTLNGHNSVAFDGTDDYLTIGTQLGKPAAYTILAVFRVTKSLSNNQAICGSLSSGGAPSTAWGVLFNRGDAAGKIEWAYGDGSNYRAQRATTTFSANTWVIAGTTHTDGIQDETIYCNGAALLNETPSYDGGVATGVSGAAYGFSIGRYGEYSTSNFHMGGSVAEFIICLSDLSDSDRQKVEGYLAHKWGLTASLPSGHPYKSVRP